MRFGQLYDWCHPDHDLDETRLQPKLHILNMKNKLPHTKPQQLQPNLESKWPSVLAKHRIQVELAVLWLGQSNIFILATQISTT